MIQTDLRNKKGLHISGDIADVSAEAILILREIYKKNEESYGETIAKGILVNMLTKAIFPEVTREDVTWDVDETQAQDYYD